MPEDISFKACTNPAKDRIRIAAGTVQRLNFPWPNPNASDSFGSISNYPYGLHTVICCWLCQQHYDVQPRRHALYEHSSNIWVFIAIRITHFKRTMGLETLGQVTVSLQILCAEESIIRIGAEKIR